MTFTIGTALLMALFFFIYGLARIATLKFNHEVVCGVLALLIGLILLLPILLGMS